LFSPLEKLRVTSVTCDRLFLVDFCDSSCLSTLHLKHSSFCSMELRHKLPGFPNLKELKIELHEIHVRNMESVASFGCHKLQAGASSLELLVGMSIEMLKQVVECRSLKKCVTSLRLSEIGAESVPRVSSWRIMSISRFQLTTFWPCCPTWITCKSRRIVWVQCVHLTSTQGSALRPHTREGSDV